jgi:ribosomal protein S18 acetylase RimI-like enzyme
VVTGRQRTSFAYTIEPLPLDGPVFEQAIAVYGDAFRQPPYNDSTRSRELRARLRGPHGGRAGFHGLVAVDDEDVVGIAYGYHSAPGQWWHDNVRREISRRDGHPTADEWLGDAYELVEIAVAPSHQGNSIGEHLIRTLLDGRPERTSVLSTRTDSRAHHLYRRLGYRELVTMRFWTGDAWYYVMGAELPLAAARDTMPPADTIGSR